MQSRRYSAGGEMSADAAKLSPDSEHAEGHVGRVPIRNLWLLMLYASDLFQIPKTDALNSEKAPDELPEMIAEILVSAVEKRLHTRLSLNYQPRSAELRRVRGRIDVLSTERRQLLWRGKIACRFQDLTMDVPRNRFVRSALETISRLVGNPELSLQCRKLAREMASMGVRGPAPTLREIGNERFGHHDARDRYMVAAAKLAFEIAIPTEEAGAHVLPLPSRDVAWVRRLFERAVGGLYKVALQPNGWKVDTGTRLNWAIEESSAGINDIFPRMQTDIVLDHKEHGRRIVVDTKFNHLLTSGWYRAESIRNSYIYQMYSYLQSQTGRGDDLADRAEGMLLHPSVGRTIDEFVTIQGHRIRFMTVDLTASPIAIRTELLQVVDLPK